MVASEVETTWYCTYDTTRRPSLDYTWCHIACHQSLFISWWSRCDHTACVPDWTSSHFCNIPVMTTRVNKRLENVNKWQFKEKWCCWQNDGSICNSTDGCIIIIFLPQQKTVSDIWCTVMHSNVSYTLLCITVHQSYYSH